MAEEAEYDFTSFGPQTDLYRSKGSNASSVASSYFTQPMYFGAAQLSDLPRTSPNDTSANAKKTGNSKPSNEPPLARNGVSTTAPSAVPTATATTAKAAPASSFAHSRSASAVSTNDVDVDDSIAQLGRNFLANKTHSYYSVPSPVLSAQSLRRPLATSGPGESAKPASSIASGANLFMMPAIHSPTRDAPLNRDFPPAEQQPHLDRAAAAAEPSPPLPGLPSRYSVSHQHYGSAPAKVLHLHLAQPDDGTSVEHATPPTRDATHDAPTLPARSTAAANQLSGPRKPTDAAAATRPSRPRMNESSGSGGTAAHRREDTAIKAPARTTTTAGGSGDSMTKARFHDLASVTSPSGALLKGEDVTPAPPVMRRATIRWDDESDGESSPSALAGVSKAAEDPHEGEEEHHVQIVIVKANTEGELAAVRPPPLDARSTYANTPVLPPLVPPPFPHSLESSRSAWLASLSNNSHADPRDNFMADEVLDVNYASGGAVHNSLIADALRIHFLSGHSATLIIANTPQCTALAEDAVSTMVQTVYQQSELMGSDFRNELSICAHALDLDGGLYDLLPTTADPQEKSEVRLGTNPVMGTRIVNTAPVNMWSMDEATFLSRALIQNARHLRADPYTDPNALLHVTVLLRQTRAPRQPEDDLEAHAEMSAFGMHVYLSSLHLLWVGHNFAVAHHLLHDKPAALWPLYRQAFGGGPCCTAVMSFVDCNDDLTYSKSTLEFSQYMRGFVNRPPRSGSVQKFLSSTAQVASEELDRNILSLERMRRDAMALLQEPAAEPCLYAVALCNGLNQQPHVGAYRVVLIPSNAPTPKKQDGGSSSSSSENNIGNGNSGVAHRRRSTVSPQEWVQSTSSSGFNGTEVQIQMPSFLKRRERSVDKGTPLSLAPLPEVSQTQLPAVQPAAHAARTSSPPPSSVRPPDSSTLNTHSRDTRVRSDRLRDQTLSLDPASSTDLQTPQHQQHQSPSISRTSHHNEEPVSSTSSYGEYIKTNVLVVPGELGSHGHAVSSSSSLSPRLPLAIVDPHTLVLTAPTARRSSNNTGEARHFVVDEVREAQYDPRTNSYQLLHNFEDLRGVHRAFAEEEVNVALLCTHCSAAVRPFQQLPLWEVVEAIMASVANTQMQLPSPSQFTVFGSVLKGEMIVRDLAEVGSQAADRPVDGQEALVGASPLFGAILYQTRGVDLFDVAEVQPVLRSMLAYADAEAGADPDVYLVLTAVRKTTCKLTPAEAPDNRPEFTWDAGFSSCTVVVTRNSMDLFTKAVAEVNGAVGLNEAVYPFGLLSEVIGGSCKSVHLLTVETSNTAPALATSMLEAQHMLGRVQNEALRSSRISVYVTACLTASRAIHAVLDNLKEHAVAGVDEAPRDITPEDESTALACAEKLEAFAEQHLEYLHNADVRGFVIYPTRTVEDMQSLFFTSARYSANSSGCLPQLQATYSSAVITSSNQHKTSILSSHPPPPPPQQSQQPPPQQGAATADSATASAKNTTNRGAGAVSVPQSVSAVALGRDSGIVAHTLLLLLHSNSDKNETDKSKKQPQQLRRTCHLSTSPTNEVTVNYGSTESVYAFDGIVSLALADTAARVSPTSNYAALRGSSQLQDAVAGCLAGYNAAMIFQETTHAQAKGVCESVCQHVCRSAVASCPREASFFLSVGYLDEHSAVDLLSTSAIHAAVHNPSVEGRSAPLLGKSPLIGVFLANAEPTPVRTSREMSESLTAAFRGDDAITAAGAPPHFLVISLWQKLYVSAEHDVSLSSMLVILTRGGPKVLQTSLAGVAKGAIAQLLLYALRGPCYTICGCGITDAEPQAATSQNPSDADFEPAMDFYQNNRNAYTGKALRYNSVNDALKSHRRELARVLEKADADRQKAQKAGGVEKLSAQDKKDRVATESAIRQLQRMIADEVELLNERMDALHHAPPFYTTSVIH
ncbi:hypothetical protein ABB37_07302 [Leptomonas pyrrhocoris]|uniref:Uncharacterized protein n=1 Tax=Leptomonas pyrrhocoris TaxID=157538 RepID=A0A0N0DT52_LEPPY|nr:hypothetical protein ABB37_07302 [Leptomonas pyrrhocoris]KPA76922.1 hypothetical protein ABB37_07302 [Leptomonas pyrrhocoris]|eukprot:XP_015655361.1 hypothetical protein ABB37_07302 [Leptomonas pyrrhocoris]